MSAPQDVQAYRPATLSDLAGWLTGSAEHERWRLVVEFLEEYRHELAADRWQLLAEEPPTVGDEHWDVLLAALAEHLAARDGRGAPGWAESRQLRQFWFPYDTRAARVDALVHAPAAFRRRGVFVAAHDLEVA
jgi:hypothetical protein